MRKPKSQFFVLKWKSNSTNLKNTKIRANKRLRRDMWVEKNYRLRSGYECCCCCRCCCCALCSMAVMRRLPIDVMCVGLALRCACGAVSHAPSEPSARSLLSLTARVCSKKQKHHSEHPREHAAVVQKTHGGVIDVASAPCQDTAA